ncbi:MAG: hypothetical protein H7Z40_19790 [Phycisphaerae bacterium]|nr:hypothetical protein [Gemmatimonadaceae bacterium]
MSALTELVQDATIGNSIAFLAFGVIAKVTLLLFAAACISAALRRSSAAVRHHVWLTAVAASLLVPVFAFLPGSTIRVPERFMPFQSKVNTTARSSAVPAPINRRVMAKDSAMSPPMHLALPTQRAPGAPSRLTAQAGSFFSSVRQTERIITLDDGTIVSAIPRQIPESAFTKSPATPVQDSTNIWFIVSGGWLAVALALMA